MASITSTLSSTDEHASTVNSSMMTTYGYEIVTENTTNGTEKHSELLQAFYLGYLWTALIIGLPGNVLIAIVYIVVKQKRTSDWFIFFLSVYDCAVCVFAVPLYLSIETGAWISTGSDLACKIEQFTIFSAQFSSVSMLGIIAIDRYLKICHPTKRSLNATQARNLGICTPLVSAIVATPILVWDGNVEKRYCRIQEQYKRSLGVKVHLCLTFGFFVFMFFVVIFCYSNVVVVVRRRIRRHKENALKRKHLMQIPAFLQAISNVEDLHGLSANGNNRNKKRFSLFSIGSSRRLSAISPWIKARMSLPSDSCGRKLALPTDDVELTSKDSLDDIKRQLDCAFMFRAKSSTIEETLRDKSDIFRSKSPEYDYTKVPIRSKEIPKETESTKVASKRNAKIGSSENVHKTMKNKLPENEALLDQTDDVFYVDHRNSEVIFHCDSKSDTERNYYIPVTTLSNTSQSSRFQETQLNNDFSQTYKILPNSQRLQEISDMLNSPKLNSISSQNLNERLNEVISCVGGIVHESCVDDTESFTSVMNTQDRKNHDFEVSQEQCEKITHLQNLEKCNEVVMKGNNSIICESHELRRSGCFHDVTRSKNPCQRDETLLPLELHGNYINRQGFNVDSPTENKENPRNKHAFEEKELYQKKIKNSLPRSLVTKIKLPSLNRPTRFVKGKFSSKKYRSLSCLLSPRFKSGRPKIGQFGCKQNRFYSDSVLVGQGQTETFSEIQGTNMNNEYFGATSSNETFQNSGDSNLCISLLGNQSATVDHEPPETINKSKLQNSSKNKTCFKESNDLNDASGNKIHKAKKDDSRSYAKKEFVKNLSRKRHIKPARKKIEEFVSDIHDEVDDNADDDPTKVLLNQSGHRHWRSLHNLHDLGVTKENNSYCPRDIATASSFSTLEGLILQPDHCSTDCYGFSEEKNVHQLQKSGLLDVLLPFKIKTKSEITNTEFNTDKEGLLKGNKHSEKSKNSQSKFPFIAKITDKSYNNLLSSGINAIDTGIQMPKRTVFHESQENDTLLGLDSYNMNKLLKSHTPTHSESQTTPLLDKVSSNVNTKHCKPDQREFSYVYQSAFEVGHRRNSDITSQGISKYKLNEPLNSSKSELSFSSNRCLHQSKNENCRNEIISQKSLKINAKKVQESSFALLNSDYLAVKSKQCLGVDSNSQNYNSESNVKDWSNNSKHLLIETESASPATVCNKSCSGDTYVECESPCIKTYSHKSLFKETDEIQGTTTTDSKADTPCSHYISNLRSNDTSQRKPKEGNIFVDSNDCLGPDTVREGHDWSSNHVFSLQLFSCNDCLNISQDALPETYLLPSGTMLYEISHTKIERKNHVHFLFKEKPFYPQNLDYQISDNLSQYIIDMVTSFLFSTSFIDLSFKHKLSSFKYHLIWDVSLQVNSYFMLETNAFSVIPESCLDSLNLKLPDKKSSFHNSDLCKRGFTVSDKSTQSSLLTQEHHTDSSFPEADTSLLYEHSLDSFLPILNNNNTYFNEYKQFCHCKFLWLLLIKEDFHNYVCPFCLKPISVFYYKALFESNKFNQAIIHSDNASFQKWLLRIKSDRQRQKSMEEPEFPEWVNGACVETDYDSIVSGYRFGQPSQNRDYSVHTFVGNKLWSPDLEPCRIHKRCVPGLQKSVPDYDRNRREMNNCDTRKTTLYSSGYKDPFNENAYVSKICSQKAVTNLGKRSSIASSKFAGSKSFYKVKAKRVWQSLPDFCNKNIEDLKRLKDDYSSEMHIKGEIIDTSKGDNRLFHSSESLSDINLQNSKEIEIKPSLKIEKKASSESIINKEETSMKISPERNGGKCNCLEQPMLTSTSYLLRPHDRVRQFKLSSSNIVNHALHSLVPLAIGSNKPAKENREFDNEDAQYIQPESSELNASRSVSTYTETVPPENSIHTKETVQLGNSRYIYAKETVQLENSIYTKKIASKVCDSAINMSPIAATKVIHSTLLGCVPTFQVDEAPTKSNPGIIQVPHSDTCEFFVRTIFDSLFSSNSYPFKSDPCLSTSDIDYTNPDFLEFPISPLFSENSPVKQEIPNEPANSSLFHIAGQNRQKLNSTFDIYENRVRQIRSPQRNGSAQSWFSLNDLSGKPSNSRHASMMFLNSLRRQLNNVLSPRSIRHLFGINDTQDNKRYGRGAPMSRDTLSANQINVIITRCESLVLDKRQEMGLPPIRDRAATLDPSTLDKSSRCSNETVIHCNQGTGHNSEAGAKPRASSLDTSYSSNSHSDDPSLLCQSQDLSLGRSRGASLDLLSPASASYRTGSMCSGISSLSKLTECSAYTEHSRSDCEKITRRSADREHNITKLLGVITFMFVISWSVSWSVILIDSLTVLPDMHMITTNDALDLARNLFLVNHFCNVLVYAVLSKSFRDRMAQCYKACIKCFPF